MMPPISRATRIGFAVLGLGLIFVPMIVVGVLTRSVAPALFAGMGGGILNYVLAGALAIYAARQEGRVRGR
jgi:hypothetical protein